MVDEGYILSLYGPLEKTLDQKAMSPEFAEVFIAEVDKGTGFKRGGTSFVVAGPSATIDCKAAFACLFRAEEPAVMFNVQTIARRLTAQYIPRWKDADDELLDFASCIIIHQLLDEQVIESLTDQQRSAVAWFVQDAIESGIVVVLSHDNEDADLNILGEVFGNYLEQHFEVLNVTGTPQKKNKPTDAKRKHSGNAGFSKRR